MPRIRRSRPLVRRAFALLGLAAALLVGWLAASNAGAAGTPTITWTGIGDGTRWEDPLNWDELRTPRVGDRVLIPDVAGTAEVVLVSAVTVETVTSDEPLRIRTTSGTLTLSSLLAGGEAELRKPLILDNGGGITGGKVTFVSTGAVLRVTTGYGRLNGVHVVGRIEILEQFTELRITNGLTLDGSARVAYEADMIFSGTQTLSGAADVHVASGTLAVDNSTLTLAEGVRVRGEGTISAPGSAGLVNHGSIVAPAPEDYAPRVQGGLAVLTDRLVNRGALEASNGGTLLLYPGGLTNTGTLTVDHGILKLDGDFATGQLGSWTSNAGEVHLVGRLDNRGATFELADPAGLLLLTDDAVVVGGTLSVTPGSRIEGRSAVLEGGVTVRGPLDVHSGANGFVVRGGVTLSGTTRVLHRLTFDGTQTVNGPGPIEITGYGISATPGSTLTLGPSLTVIGSYGDIEGVCQFGPCPGEPVGLVNQGVIRVRAPVNEEQWTGLGIDVDRFRNDGTLLVEGRPSTPFGGATLTIRPRPENLSPSGVFAGGRWLVSGGGTIAILEGNAFIHTLAAEVSLDGEYARFTTGVDEHYTLAETEVLGRLSTITSSGSLRLGVGRLLFLSGPLTNNGTLDLRSGATLVTPGGFTTRGRLVVGLGPRNSTGHVYSGDQNGPDDPAVLAGRLDIQRDDGFDPDPCSAYRFITSTQSSGSFAEVTGTDLGGGRRLDPEVDEVGAVIYYDLPRTVTIDDARATEGDRIDFVLRLSVPRSRELRIPFATRDASARAGSDYGELSGTLSVLPCNATFAIVVNGLEDREFEGEEIFHVDLGRSDGAEIVRNRATGFIDDDDPAGDNPSLDGAGTPPPPGGGSSQPVGSGYWMVDRAGFVSNFGAAGHHGHASGGAAPIVDLEPTPSGGGYWIVDQTGGVVNRGDASFLGRVAPQALQPGEQVTALSGTPSGAGYWIFTSKGRVFRFGDAGHHGDMSGVRLNAPVLDSVALPNGRGYYMVGADGGIFAFGEAVYHGSMGGRHLNAPVQSLVPDPDGVGYWLVAADGGVFAFDAPFRGSMGGRPLNRPITGMVAFGNGYLMVGEDGGIFNFSDEPFHGSRGDNPSAQPIVAVAASPG